jgi:hypothetical protein
MSDRKAIRPSIRFEVFKRDKFACQYCGAQAPDVVLHVDHIKPVAEGGDNDLINLVTACRTCNGGNGKTELSDDSAVKRQVAQMLMEWREELKNHDDIAVAIVCEAIGSYSSFVPNEAGQADIRRWMKRYTLSELLRAVDEAFPLYLRFVDGKPMDASWGAAFAKIPLMADVERQSTGKPYLRALLYIQGIIRKRARAPRYNCVDYLEHLHLCGAAIDEMERRAKAMRNLEDFEGPYDRWLDSIGRPF